MFKYFVFIFLLMCTQSLRAQDSLPVRRDTERRVITRPRPAVPPRPVVADSTLRIDSTRLDSVRVDSTKVDSSVNPMTHPFISVRLPARLDSPIYRTHPVYKFTNPVRFRTTVRQWQGKEAIFYALIGLLIFFALVKNGFRRYMQDLVKLFFRTTVNQRQVKEQLLQSPLPSLLLNLFFLLSVGMFVTLLLQYFRLGDYPFWLLYAYTVLALAGIYGIKFLSLKLLGWIFQVREATDGYIFIVFTTNKVIGIALLPFLLLLAFASGQVAAAAVNLSVLVVVCLFAYRFFLSYITIHRQVKINFFHFVLYLCAFELVPLLLINKLLFSLLGETY